MQIASTGVAQGATKVLMATKCTKAVPFVGPALTGAITLF